MPSKQTSIFVLPKVSSLDLAIKTKGIIVSAISEKTGLSSGSVAKRVTVIGNTKTARVSVSGKAILINEFNPTFIQSSNTRASVSADTSMVYGTRSIRNAFLNPKVGLLAKRKSKKAYPLTKVYGPSIKTLFLQDQVSILEPIKEQIEDTLSNGRL